MLASTNFMKFEIEIVEARFNGIALRLPFNGNQRNVAVSTKPHDVKQMQRRNVLAVVYLYDYGSTRYYYLAVRNSRRSQVAASRVCSRDA